jgi:actin-like ATPase involved in cell morphogenesis
LTGETLAQVRKNGIVFTGGVSSINGLVEYASKRLNMPTSVVENPKDAVILGAGKLLSLNKGDYPYIKL